MIYVVLGMHKSGTTLISQILHKSGIVMGVFDEAISYDSGNQYERKETLELNMEVLRTDYDDFSLDVITPIEKSDSSVSGKMIELINHLEKYHKKWGFKDPRICLTYNLWNQYLPEHKLIIVYRSPVEIWYHYTKKIQWWRFVRLMKRGIKALKAWYVYNSQTVKIVRATSYDYVVFNYSDFMNDANSFTDLESFVGEKLVDTRQKNLYRAKGEETLFFKLAKKVCYICFSMDINSMYNTLSRLA